MTFYKIRCDVMRRSMADGGVCRAHSFKERTTIGRETNPKETRWKSMRLFQYIPNNYLWIYGMVENHYAYNTFSSKHSW